MTIQQVYSSASVEFGQYVKLFWIPTSAFPGDGGTVPPGHTLEITTITFAFFPKKKGILGRADIAGRDAPDLATGTSSPAFDDNQECRDGRAVLGRLGEARKGRAPLGPTYVGGVGLREGEGD